MEAEVRRFEGLLPRPLPPDFVRSLLIHDGMQTDRYRWFGYQGLLPLGQIENTWQIMCSLQDECGFGGSQITETRRLKNDAHWRAGWVPVADADGDKLVLDLDPGPEGDIGQVFHFSNSDSSPNRVLAASFAGYLDAIAEELSRYRFGISEFGGIRLEKQ